MRKNGTTTSTTRPSPLRSGDWNSLSSSPRVWPCTCRTRPSSAPAAPRLNSRARSDHCPDHPRARLGSVSKIAPQIERRLECHAMMRADTTTASIVVGWLAGRLEVTVLRETPVSRATAPETAVGCRLHHRLLSEGRELHMFHVKLGGDGPQPEVRTPRTKTERGRRTPPGAIGTGWGRSYTTSEPRPEAPWPFRVSGSAQRNPARLTPIPAPAFDAGLLVKGLLMVRRSRRP